MVRPSIEAMLLELCYFFDSVAINISPTPRIMGVSSNIKKDRNVSGEHIGIFVNHCVVCTQGKTSASGPVPYIVKNGVIINSRTATIIMILWWGALDCRSIYSIVPLTFSTITLPSAGCDTSLKWIPSSPGSATVEASRNSQPISSATRFISSANCPDFSIES